MFNNDCLLKFLSSVMYYEVCSKFNHGWAANIKKTVGRYCTVSFERIVKY